VISSVIFDLDGTLVDSAVSIIAGLVEAMEAEGVPVPSPEEMRAVIGPPFTEGLPKIGVPADKLEAVIAHYRRVYNGGGMFNAALFAGVEQLLQELAAAGVVLGVATSKPEDSAVRILEHIGVASRFAVIAGADIALGRHDKAEVIERALGMLGDSVGPDGMVMIGDRHHDIEGARQHGIETIAAAWGYGSAAEHEAHAAMAIAATPAAVARIILG
jgi:phosphoglycolate phosphatase